MFAVLLVVLSQAPELPAPPLPPPEPVVAPSPVPDGPPPSPSLPPLVPGPDRPDVPPAPPSQVFDRPATAAPAPPPPTLNAVNLMPLSLFGLYLTGEYERAIAPSASVFGSLGIGALTQFGAEAGARFYLTGRALDGFYVDARGELFTMLTNSMVLVGPGAQLGFAFKRNNVVITIGAGASLWYPLRVGRPVGGLGLFFGPATTATVFVLPGLFQPPAGTFGVEPTLRFSMGPAF
jgi:hypothetical protein